MYKLGLFLLGAAAGVVGAGAAAWLYGEHRIASSGSSCTSSGGAADDKAKCCANRFKNQRAELAEKMALILESCREFASTREAYRWGDIDEKTEERIKAIRLECAELDLIRANFEKAFSADEASTYEPGLLVKILREVRDTAENLLADRDFVVKERHFIEDVRMLRRTTGNLLRVITGKDEFDGRACPGNEQADFGESPAGATA